MQKRKLWISIVIGVAIIFGLGIAAFLLWAENPYLAMPEAIASLESDALVQVETDPWITFMPQGQAPSTGFVFYPGGLVATEAYAPAARAIAEHSYLVVITPMPLHLAVLNAGVAAEVMTAHPEIENWAVGGHSLGGSMAATFANQNLNIDGLILWAAYPAENNDLSGQEIAVSSIYGTLDGLATPEKVLAAKPLLPTNTIWVPIEGGNHAQFGWYGEQDGDNQATISREQQQAEVVEATLALLIQMETNHE